MRVTVIQMSPGHVLTDNIAAARDLIEQACRADRPDLIMLPEMWSCLGGTLEDKRAAAEILPSPDHPAQGGPIHLFLSDTARAIGVTLHGGSIGEMAGERIYNTSLVFGPDGAERARYRKIHLFDVVTPSGERYCESDVYRAGSETATFAVGETVVGCAICYDLRFGYLFEKLRDLGSELIVLPAAFTAETGRAHWEVMLRARAIETQSWIAAAGTTGTFTDQDGRTRTTFGHSMICDPWGRVVAQAGDGPGWATAVLDPAVTERVRSAMPIWQHRRNLTDGPAQNAR
jgi:nitrilase